MSLGLVCNLYQEANALPGFLEMAHAGGFDEVCFYHTGPGGAHSTDGTIELIEKWGARLEFGSIDEGFGVVRTGAIRLSTCEWVMILDADERFHAVAPTLRCGDDLAVSMGAPYSQMQLLRSYLSNTSIDAVRTSRRHWYDFSWRKPTQNWEAIPDWQLRIVRNSPHIQYTPLPRMHERLIDDRTGREPEFAPNMPVVIPFGPFHDHYHCFFKPMEADQRAQDIATYNALHEGRPVLSPALIGS